MIEVFIGFAAGLLCGALLAFALRKPKTQKQHHFHAKEYNNVPDLDEEVMGDEGHEDYASQDFK